MVPYFESHSFKMFIKEKFVRFGIKISFICSLVEKIINLYLGQKQIKRKQTEAGLSAIITKSGRCSEI